MLISIEISGIHSWHFSVPPFVCWQSHMSARDHVSISHVSYITAAGIVRSSHHIVVIAIFIRAGIVRACQSHNCQSNIYQSWNWQRLCQSISLSARVIRDYIRATLARATFIIREIVRNYIRVYFDIPVLSETRSGQHLLDPYISEPKLETISECAFIAKIIRVLVAAIHVRPTLITPRLPDNIRATLVSSVAININF